MAGLFSAPKAEQLKNTVEGLFQKLVAYTVLKIKPLYSPKTLVFGLLLTRPYSALMQEVS